MGKIKEAMLDIEDDMHSIAREGASDLLYAIQDHKDDIRDQMMDILDDDDMVRFIEYLGGDKDDLHMYIDNVLGQALADEGIDV